MYGVWVVAWLSGWLVDWPVVCLAGWLSGWLVGGLRFAWEWWAGLVGLAELWLVGSLTGLMNMSGWLTICLCGWVGHSYITIDWHHEIAFSFFFVRALAAPFPKHCQTGHWELPAPPRPRVRRRVGLRVGPASDLRFHQKITMLARL